jgi:hypothetical protein
MTKPEQYISFIVGEVLTAGRLVAATCGCAGFAVCGVGAVGCVALWGCDWSCAQAVAAASTIAKMPNLFIFPPDGRAAGMSLLRAETLLRDVNCRLDGNKAAQPNQYKGC